VGVTDWSTILQAIIGVAALAVLGFLVASYYQFLRGKYYFERQEAGQRAKRLGYLLVLLLLTLLGVRVVTPWVDPYLARLSGRLNTATLRRIFVWPTPVPSATWTPTVVIVSPSPSHTQPVATSTPSATAAVGEIASPAVSTPRVVAPSPEPRLTRPPVALGMHFGPLVLARDMDAAKEPVDEGQAFSLDDRPVYAFFQYRDMQNGMFWSQEWHREGELLWRGDARWSWGQAGRSWVFYTPPYGWTAGSYEVRLYLEGRLEQAATFSME